MQAAGSITWTCLGAPAIALAGQARRQRPQALHLSAMTEKVMRAVQTPAGHFRSRMWARYSSRKWLKLVRKGFGAVRPSPQSDVEAMTPDSRSSVRRSSSVPFPSVTRVSSSSIRFVPSRQGVHLPQDSRCRNST